MLHKHASLTSYNSPSSLWMRKWFHLFAVLVYLPGLVLQPDYLAMAASLILFLATVLEVSLHCTGVHVGRSGQGLHLGLGGEAFPLSSLQPPLFAYKVAWDVSFCLPILFLWKP